MNRNEQELYKDIKRVAIALENNKQSGLVNKRPKLARNPKIKHV